MAMNINSSFCRLLKRTVSLSFGDALHGPLIGTMKQQCHNIPLQEEEEEETDAFMLTNPYMLTGPIYRWTNFCSPRCTKLRSGMILVKDYINLIGQVEIVNLCEKWGLGPAGFYQPCNQSGAERRLHMTCFGRNWDPVTRYENPYRCDGSEPPLIPDELISFTRGIFKHSLIDLDGLPLMTPDVCIVNSYESDGLLDLHQDCDESSDSLGRGLPVVSISIGKPAEFWYGDTIDENKLDKVLLESGDLLIFGGKSRLIYHGVKRIVPAFPTTVSTAGRLMGRLNVTLRQF